ncbi:MAG: hypothetical protein RLZZ543_653 [Bacteroidota bacterium]|jgi:hypothetical protein
MPKYLYLALLSIVAFARPASAQQTIIALDRNDTIPVFNIDSVQLTFPFTGGFNYMQGGAMDLNNDGIQDLVLFDRTGDRILPFLYTGTPGVAAYKFAWEYVYAFPKVKEFMLVKDFNCDGKADIFTYENSGFKVYKNTSSEANGLQFEVYTSSLLSYFNPASLPIYCIPVDIPVIEDMDNDGDQDILVFGILGTCVEYHRNMAQEQLSRCDTLMLKLESDNWGVFTESFSTNDVNLNDSCDHPLGGRLMEARHAGSSMLAFDADADGDKDLILGDIAYRTMTQLINGGTAQVAHVTSSVPLYPTNTTFVNLPIFPAAFYIDIDHDGKRDLMVSPNNEGGSENHNCIWYYHNDGSDNAPVFTWIKKSLFVDESLDFGEGSIPIFFDYNNDGLDDIIVGNYGYFQPAGTYKSQLALLKNISTETQTRFQLITNDFAGLASLAGNSLNYHPTFGDIDGDSDADMLLGTSDGRLFYFINTANAGSPANFVFSDPNFQGIDIGTFAAPQLVDVDLDGLLDVLIGSREGRIYYYHNSGTVTAMNLELVSNTWGNILTTANGDPSGFSTPHLYRKSGVSYIICGSQSGIYRLYSNIDGNLAGDFTLEDSLLLGNRNGERTSICLKDLNDDGFPEAITGNYAGGVNFYQGIFASSITDQHPSKTSAFVVFPNPGSSLYVRSLKEKIQVIDVLDIQGRSLASVKGNGNPTQEIDMSGHSAGLYFIRIKGTLQTEVLHWVKQ